MIEFHEAQNHIAKDKHRFRVAVCGRRFGKTILACYELVGKACAKPDNNVAYIATTYAQARDLAWNELKKITLPVQVSVNEARHPFEIVVKTKGAGESKITLRGWESIETLRGMAFSFIVMDEVAMMKNFQLNWQEVVRPTLTDKMGEALFISTPKGFNHLFDLFHMEEKDTDFKSFRFTSYDNPYIRIEELEKAKKELTEDRFSQEYMADFRKTEGLVYKEFDREKHVTTEDMHNVIETCAGVDFGYTNPSCILKIQKNNDNHFLVREEWYKTGKTNQEIIEYAKTIGATEFFPDPAEPDRIEEMLRAGLNVRDVNKDIAAGIDSVRNLLKQGKLTIHASCVNLISEFETYAFKPKITNQNEPEEPLKENDHGMDALRYALFMKAPKMPNTNFYPEIKPFVAPQY